jgi:hypothetical protein
MASLSVVARSLHNNSWTGSCRSCRHTRLAFAMQRRSGSYKDMDRSFQWPGDAHEVCWNERLARYNRCRCHSIPVLAASLKAENVKEEETSPHPILKIWNTRHDDRKTGAPRLLVSGRIPHTSSSSRSHPVSTLAITPTLSLVAVGYADGTVQILRQLDQYIQSGSASSSAGPAGLPKPKLVHSSPSNPITGLGFRLPSASAGLTNTITNTLAQPAGNTAGSASDGAITLFIVTTHQILTYATTSTGRALTGTSAHATVMDDVGAALGCSAMLTTGEIVLAKDEAIFVYGPEGRGQSYFYEGRAELPHRSQPELRMVLQARSQRSHLT